MRKEYRTAAIRILGNELARRFPAYAPWKPVLPPVAMGRGQAFFRRPTRSGGCVFIGFTPHVSSDDAFFVGLGWSALDCLPDVMMWPTASATPGRAELDEPEGVVRLLDHPSGEEMWSAGGLEHALAAGESGMTAHLQRMTSPVSPAEAEAHMRPAVQRAIGALERWGAGYLDEAALRLESRLL
jgi:hypothetical protein